MNNRLKELKKLLKTHHQWIKNNLFDEDGIKERLQWIEECEKEIAELEHKND